MRLDPFAISYWGLHSDFITNKWRQLWNKILCDVSDQIYTLFNLIPEDFDIVVAIGTSMFVTEPNAMHQFVHDGPCLSCITGWWKRDYMCSCTFTVTNSFWITFKSVQQIRNVKYKWLVMFIIWRWNVYSVESIFLISFCFDRPTNRMQVFSRYWFIA